MSTTGTYTDRSAPLPMKNREPMQNVNKVTVSTGVTLEGNELEDYCKRRGLCPLCAKTRTRKRVFKLFKRNKWEMLTLLNKDGSYKVYKGYCVKPKCFTLEQAKRLAGDIVVSNDPRRRNLQRVSSRSRSTERSTAGTTADSDNDSVFGTTRGSNLAHKRNPEAFPPPELRNATNFIVNEDKPLFVVEKAVEGLQQNSNTTVILELSGLKLRTIDFETLAEGLKVNSTLSSLILENSKLDDEHISIIASGLEKASDIPITKLYLRSNQVGDRGIDALGPFLQANTTLEKFDVSRNCVSSHGAMAIFSAFLHNRLTRIRTINLSHNALWDLDDDTTGIEPFLTKNRSLRILNLEGNHLNDESVHAVAGGLKNNDHTSLERLYLGWNSIGDEGTIALAEMLEVNTSLKVLGLGENGIQNAGARALLTAMDQNTTIKEISGLWRNAIDRRFIIVAIRRLLLSAERSDAIRAKLYEQSPSNNAGRMSTHSVELDSAFDDPAESSRISVGAGTAVSTMTNDLDFADPSTGNGPGEQEVPPRHGRKPTHVQVFPQQLDDMGADAEGIIGVPYDRLIVLQANPLASFIRETGANKPIPMCDIDNEATLIQKAMTQVTAGKIDVNVGVATMERFTAVFEKPSSSILHFSCNGDGDHLSVVLEDGLGSVQTISMDQIRNLVASSERKLQVVFVSARNARAIGQVLVDAGISHVVCCTLDHRYRDLVGLDFVENFYRATAGKKTLKHSFQIARSAACSCPYARTQRRVAERFCLLPERSDTDSYHNVPVFYTGSSLLNPKDEDDDKNEPVTSANSLLPKLPQQFIGREVEMLEILEALRVDDIVRIRGSQGCGKGTVVAGLCHYAFKRRDAFQFDNIFWLPSPEGVVAEEDTLYEDLCQCINSIKDSKSEDEDDTLLDRIEIELESLQALLVLDERQFYNASLSGLEKFISFVLNVGSCKVLLLENWTSTDGMSSISHISRETTGSRFDEAIIEIHPLDLRATAQLFGETSKFIASSSIPAAHDAAEFAELMEPCYLRHSEMGASSLMSQRRWDLYSRMGHGLPAEVLQAATNMAKRDFIELIGIANRPEVYVDSLSALDFEIQLRSKQKSKAVDDKNFLRAMDLDTLIEELDSMRPEFPTLHDLKEEEEAMKQDLAEAVTNRRYDVANELKRELLTLKKKIIREQRLSNKASAKADNTANDRATELEAQVQSMVTSSRDSLLLSSESGYFKSESFPTTHGGEFTFAVSCGDHRDCSFVVCVGNVLDFCHPAEARGIVCWTNESCQLEGTGGDTLMRMGGSTLRHELFELPTMVKTPYGPVRCATGNAIIMGPSQYGIVASPCIIFAVGPLSPTRSEGQSAADTDRNGEAGDDEQDDDNKHDDGRHDEDNHDDENGEDDKDNLYDEDDDLLSSADSLAYIKTMLRSCYRSSMVLAKHAELQALALNLSTKMDSPLYGELIRVGLQTLVEEVQFTHLRDLHLMARNLEEASLLVNLLHDMGHRPI